MKKIFSLALTLIFILTLSINVFAATANPIEPLWNNTQSIQIYFNFDGENSMACGNVGGKAGTTRIDATIKVYEANGTGWTYLGENSGGLDFQYMSISTDFTAVEGVYYKIIFTVHVTNSLGEVESIQKAHIQQA